MTKVLITGTGGPTFGRNQQIIRLLEKSGCIVSIRSHSMWQGDKTDSVSTGKVALVFRALRQYTKVIGTTVSAGVRRRPDVVMALHPSQIDAVIVGLLCKVFRLPLVIDFFVSLHETVVEDRGLISNRSIGGRFLGRCDQWAARLATRVMTDTPEDADFFASVTKTPRHKWSVVWVGANPSIYVPRIDVSVEPRSVLFYGTYIPLQGIEHIVRASALMPSGISMTLIGNGQERARIESIIAAEKLPVTLVDSVSEEVLAEHIARASVCLGVFGDGPKTARVIPNKVFQCLAMGKAIVTGDTPAMVTLGDAVITVPVADPKAIADAVATLLRDDKQRHDLELRARQMFVYRFDEDVIAGTMAEVIAQVVDRSGAVAPLTIMARLREPYISKLVRGVRPSNILEVGAGQGAMGTRLSQFAPYVGIEPDVSSAAVAMKRFASIDNADFRGGGIERVSTDEKFDVVCAFEVLEHIEDDAGAISQWLSHLRDGGTLVLSVPAHQSRYGVSDRAVGHFRRYDAQMIDELCTRTGCEVVARYSYGAVGGHALEGVRNAVLKRRGDVEFGATGHHDVAQRTAASGRLFQPSSRWGGMLTAVIGAPMRVVQVPFSRTSVGVGWVVALRKRGTV